MIQMPNGPRFPVKYTVQAQFSSPSKNDGDVLPPLPPLREGGARRRARGRAGGLVALSTVHDDDYFTRKLIEGIFNNSRRGISSRL